MNNRQYKLSESTVALLHEVLEREIEDFYQDPEETLEIEFNKPEDVEVCAKYVADLCIAATEIGLDFAEILKDQFVANSVKRLSELMDRANKS